MAVTNTTQALLQLMQQYLPQLLQQFGGQGTTSAQQQLATANELLNPTDTVTAAQQALDRAGSDPYYKQYMDLKNAGKVQQANQLLKQHRPAITAAERGVALAQTNLDQAKANPNKQPLSITDIQRQTALAGAQTNAAQLAGAGGDAARNAVSLNQELNPDYYKSIGAASKGAADTVGAINLAGLSPGEAASVERGLNQYQSATGNLGLLNPTNTITNALNFGGAFNNKVQLLQNASANAANVAGVASGGGGVNPTNVALGQPNTSTMSTFGAGQGAQSQGFNLFGPLLGTGGSLINTNVQGATQTGLLNQPTSYMNSIANDVGAIGSLMPGKGGH